MTKNLPKGPRIEWKSALNDFEWARHGACLCPRRNEYWQEMDEILQLMHFQVEASELGTLMVNCVQTTNIFLNNIFHSSSRRFLSQLIDEIFSYLHGWIIMQVNGQLCAKHRSFSKLVQQFFEVIFSRPIFENFSWYLFILHRWIILCLDCALSKFQIYNQFL